MPYVFRWVHRRGQAPTVGSGAARRARATGGALRDVTRDYWGFAYDQGAGTVSLGPFSIEVDAVDNAVRDLCQSIWLAARKVDEKNTAELRAAWRRWRVCAKSG